MEALRWTGVAVAYLVMAGLLLGGGVALRYVTTANRASADEGPRDAEVASPTTTDTTWLLETTTTTILFTASPISSTTAPPAAARPRAVTPVAAAAPDVPADRAAVWYRLADCESGVWGAGKVPRPGSANWAVVDPIHQGGLQIRAGQWDQHRVRFPGFPDDAHLATPAQQIAVAEVILAGQGVKAWPTCGPRIGLGELVGQTASASTQATGVVSGR